MSPGPGKCGVAGRKVKPLSHTAPISRAAVARRSGTARARSRARPVVGDRDTLARSRSCRARLHCAASGGAERRGGKGGVRCVACVRARADSQHAHAGGPRRAWHFRGRGSATPAPFPSPSARTSRRVRATAAAAMLLRYGAPRGIARRDRAAFALPAVPPGELALAGSAVILVLYVRRQLQRHTARLRARYGCARCRGNLRVPCMRCYGRGSLRKPGYVLPRYRYACNFCRGTGSMRCPACQRTSV